MIIASDGVWDVLDGAKAGLVVDQLLSGASHTKQTRQACADHAARHLVDEAMRLGSSDNVSAVVLLF
jgi:serine/threonine protein phosphatase PrpC